MQQPELRHRKAMGARQRSGVERVVDNRKRQGVVLTQEVSGPFKDQAAAGAATDLIPLPWRRLSRRYLMPHQALMTSTSEYKKPGLT